MPLIEEQAWEVTIRKEDLDVANQRKPKGEKTTLIYI
jgi:hypothetical protein